jgi:hypothetical protein
MAAPPLHDGQMIQSEISAQTKAANEKKVIDKARKHKQGQDLLRAAENICPNVMTISNNKKRLNWVEDPSLQDSELEDPDPGYIEGQKGDGMYSGKNRLKRPRHGSNDNENFEGIDSMDAQGSYTYESENDDFPPYNLEDFNDENTAPLNTVSCSSVKTAAIADNSLFGLGGGVTLMNIIKEATKMSQKAYPVAAPVAAPVSNYSFEQEMQILQMKEKILLLEREAYNRK